MKVRFAGDVYVSVYAAVTFFVGATTVVGAGIWALTGAHSMCEVLPFFSVGVALMVPLNWQLRRARRELVRIHTLVGLVAGSAALAILWVLACRL